MATHPAHRPCLATAFAAHAGPSTILVRMVRCAAALACLGTGGAIAAPAAMEVAFVEPQGYADFGHASWEIERNERVLSAHMRKLGARYLAPDQSLKVEVLDVDLAGEVERGQRGNVRLLSNRADSPSITVRYTVDSPGMAPQQGEERIVDMDYMPMREVTGLYEAMAYERYMLEQWFKARFASAQVSGQR